MPIKTSHQPPAIFVLLLVLALVLTACAASSPSAASGATRTLLDFEAGIEGNPYGGAAYCEAARGASLVCSRSTEGSAALNLAVEDVGGNAYALWRTDLAGPATDISAYQALRLSVRGQGAGLRPHLYLIDRDGRRAFVDLTRFGQLSVDWRIFTVPLRWFKDAQGRRPDLSRLAEFQIVFEWQEMAGRFEVDDVTLVEQVRRQVSLMRVPGPVASPPGFALTVYASGFLNATSITWGPQGALWLSQRRGNIWRLMDGDGDGRADQAALFASGFSELVGLLWHPEDGWLYASSRGTITALRDRDGDGRADEYRQLVSGLPWGRHQNNGMAWGPDGWLYFGIGSTGDISPEENALSATIVRMPHLGTRADLEVVARGVRNAYDLAFNAAGDLFAGENGPDYNDAPDELNHILPGRHYGYPLAFGDDGGGGLYRMPLWNFAPHAGAGGLTVYEGTRFPRDYRGNIFIALSGQSFTPATVGHEVQRVVLTPAGGSYTAQAQTFLSGLDRPLDVTVGPDEALYVLDYGEGTVYRVLYGER